MDGPDTGTSPLGTAGEPLDAVGSASGRELTSEQLAQLRRARAGARRIRRACGFAAFSGWSMILFAAITLALGFLDPLLLATGAILLGLGVNELRGGSRLRRLDPRGGRILAINQAFLGALIVAYAIVRLQTASGHAETLLAQTSTGDPQFDEMIGGLVESAALMVYGTLAAAGVLIPGLTAVYYLSRGRTARDYVERTPPWVVQALREIS